MTDQHVVISIRRATLLAAIMVVFVGGFGRANADRFYIENQQPPWHHADYESNRPLRVVTMHRRAYFVDPSGHTFQVARDRQWRIFPAYYSEQTRQYYPWYYDPNYNQYYHVVHTDNGWYRCYARNPNYYYATNQTYTDEVPGPQYYPEYVSPSGYQYPSNNGYASISDISPLTELAALLPILGGSFQQFSPSYSYAPPGYTVPQGQTVYVQNQYVTYSPVTIINNGVATTTRYYCYTPRPAQGYASSYVISRHVIAPPPPPPARYIAAAVARPIRFQVPRAPAAPRSTAPVQGRPASAGTGRPNAVVPTHPVTTPGHPASSGVGHPNHAVSAHPTAKPGHPTSAGVGHPSNPVAPHAVAKQAHPTSAGVGHPNHVVPTRPATKAKRPASTDVGQRNHAIPAPPRRVAAPRSIVRRNPVAPRPDRYGAGRPAGFGTGRPNIPVHDYPVNRMPQTRPMMRSPQPVRGGGFPNRAPVRPNMAPRPVMARPAPRPVPRQAPAPRSTPRPTGPPHPPVQNGQ